MRLPRPGARDRGCPWRSDARPPPAVEVPAAPRRALPGPAGLDAQRTCAGCAPQLRRRLLGATFDDYLAAVELLRGRRGDAARGARTAGPECPHAPVIARLRCFRGIDTLSAAGLAPKSVTSIASPSPPCSPGSSASCPASAPLTLKRRQGSITKAGPSHARRLLVEAATTTATGRASARRSHAAKDGQDPRMIEIAWRAQRRLYQRWQHLPPARASPPASSRSPSPANSPRFLWEAATLD